MFPSIQVNLPQAIWTSFDETEELIVKFSVITESQPKEDPFGMVKVGVLVDDE